MTANEILKKYEDDNEYHLHEVDRKWLIAAMEEYAALRQQLVSGSLPLAELEKDLGDTKRKFVIWHDGGEWLISLKHREQKNCKTLKEWLSGNDR